MTSHARRRVPQTPSASITCTQPKFRGPGGIFQTVKNSSTGVITTLLQLHHNWIWPEKQGQERLYDKMMWHHYCTFIYPWMIVKAVNSGAIENKIQCITYKFSFLNILHIVLIKTINNPKLRIRQININTDHN